MKYKIGETPVKDIIKEFGTPLYIYDANHIVQQYQKLSKAFDRINHRIHYAMKANENPAILNILKELGAGIDAVSPYEIDRALNLGFDSKDIVFTPSCAPIGEIKYALLNKINVHIGAIEYFPMLGSFLKGRNIGLRLNPNVEIEGNQKIATAHSDSKFGIPIIYLDKIKEYEKQYGFSVNSLHIHTGSNVKNVNDLKTSIINLFKYIHIFNNIEYLDIGSGLKIKYQDTDNEIDINEYGIYIKQKLNEINKNIEIKIEPGKFLVGNAGYLLASVNIVKQGYNKQFVGVNSGFNHLIRPMYYDAYHEIINISNPTGNLKQYDIVGQLCEEDTFAKDRDINEVKQGDILMFKSAGAYSYSMSMDYNLRKKPKEVLVVDDKVVLI
jgi:diaminopimelate decarboxylase